MGGLLFHAGYFMGNNLHPARKTNPKGFFEDIEINRINDRILGKYDFSRLHATFPHYPNKYSPFNPRRGHRWLSWIKPGTVIMNDDPEIHKMITEALNQKKPFAYKDPRFNYTLSIWEEALPEDIRYICMFRNPGTTIKSVIEECRIMEYMKDFYIDYDLGFQVWYNFYRHLLDTLSEESLKKTLFLAYEELLQHNNLENLSCHLNVKMTGDFIDPSLNRTRSDKNNPAYVEQLYQELVRLHQKT